jgi:MFS family permease
MNKNYRPAIAALIALLFYTVTDILIWQRIFEANQMVEYANTYHAGWLASLVGYALIGVLLMWGGWKDCIYFLIALFVSAFSGLEDVLYYVLDRKPIPIELPWLNNNPMIFESSRNGVVGSALFWVGALTILYVVLYLRSSHKTPIPAPISDL